MEEELHKTSTILERNATNRQRTI
ncbi:uncharacterized protein G2W53_034878 [Senna tora]|uniref:Uncharacterized protein n=1 Tax=Senna tora TaxID=362788 RepID=A0A834T504_9FABA|nr:uncharacterized protein G2W53_034878 [Senna tora]